MSNELYHHGILGMKWGVRRFQNEDGSLTEEGKRRYYDLRDAEKKYYETYSSTDKRALKKASDRYAQAQLLINPKRYRESLGDAGSKIKDAKNTVHKADLEAMSKKNPLYQKAVKEAIKRDMEVREVLYEMTYSNNPTYREAKEFVDKYGDIPYSELI